MTPDELDRLEALAIAAEAQEEWDRQVGDAIGELEAACDPDTIRRLVAAAREPLDVERLAMFVDDECRTLARAIAAEYAALRKPVTA